MARTTIASLQAEIAALREQISAAPAKAEVHSHWTDRDLAVPCCKRRFRTEKGRAFHLALRPHPAK